MTITCILSAILIGLVIGVLGRLVAPGRQHIPVWLTVAVGIVAALVGSALVGSLRNTNGIDWIELFVQVVLAAVGVSVASAMRSRRRHHIWS